MCLFSQYTTGFDSFQCKVQHDQFPFICLQIFPTLPERVSYSKLAGIMLFKKNLQLQGKRYIVLHYQNPVSYTHLAHDLKIPFIVVTAHKELEKLEKIKELKPLGYFTKPLDKLSLEYLLFNNFSADHRVPMENHQKPDSFLIKIKSKWETVHFTNTMYFQVKGNYVEIHQRDRIITYRSSLASLINQINGSQFIRLHRNYFVNKQYITGYDLHKKLIDLGDEIKLPVSRNYRRNLKGVLNQG